MFFTIVSRTVISKINTSRDYFYIFLIGAIGYIVLHWYLHMEIREGIVEKVREYIYYLMVIDAVVAYVLMVMYPPKTDKKEEDKTNDDDKNDKEAVTEYSPDQKRLLLQRMQEVRRMQQAQSTQQAQLKQQVEKSEKQEQTNSGAKHSQTKDSEIKVNDDIKDDDKEISESNNKKSIFSKSKGNSDQKIEEDNDEEENQEGQEGQDPEDCQDGKCVVNNTNQKDIKLKKKSSEDTDIPIFESK